MLRDLAHQLTDQLRIGLHRLTVWDMGSCLVLGSVAFLWLLPYVWSLLTIGQRRRTMLSKKQMKMINSIGETLEISSYLFGSLSVVVLLSTWSSLSTSETQKTCWLINLDLLKDKHHSGMLHHTWYLQSQVQYLAS